MPKPAEFLGPFLGLNDTLDPSQIGPAFAVKARNVILSDGRIRPRMAWRHLRFTADRDAIQLGTDQAIASLYHWNRSESTDAPDVLVKTRNRYANLPFAGQLWIVERNRVARQLATGLSNQSAQFIKYNGLIYVLDGSERIWITNGEANGTIYAGMERPTADEVWAELETHSGATLAATVQYAVTFVNLHGGESNPLYFGGGVHDSGDATPMYVASGKAAKFTVSSTRRDGPARAYQFRIYRRNMSEGQVGWRLIHEDTYPTDGGSVTVYDHALEDEITLSSDVTGPFAPSRHGLMARASMGAIYRHRLFFTDAAYAPNVYFSNVGEPQHVDVDDKIPLEGEPDDGINGMAAQGDQLFIGKETGIHVISGEIQTPTDETNATGAQPLESNHRAYPTNASPGPTGNIEGNNFVKAGEPSRLMYLGKAGLYDFDGVNNRFVGDGIKRTWSSFGYKDDLSVNDRGRESFEFAHDSAEGILYICAGRSASDPSHQVLAYHYRVNRGDGLGIWTTIDAGDISPWAAPTDESKTITAIASSLGERRGGTRRSSILVGFRDGTLAIGDADTADLPMPAFEWESGDMILDRGLRVHVYVAKFFYSVIQGVIGMAHAAPVDFEVVLKQGKYLRPAAATADLADETREHVAMPVQREGSRFSVKLTKADNWTKAADLGVGILGWEMETERVGAA